MSICVVLQCHCIIYQTVTFTSTQPVLNQFGSYFIHSAITFASMSVLVVMERNMKNVAFINASLLLYPFSKCFTQLSHHIMRYRFAGLQKKGETGEPSE